MGAGNHTGASIGLDTLFFGRERELDALQAEIGDPAARAILVVGQPGMGKSEMVRALARRLEGLDTRGGLRCGCVAYEVTPNDTPRGIMARMVRDAFEAAAQKKPMLSFDEKKWKAFMSAVGCIPGVGGTLKSLGELLATLAPDPAKDERDALLERLQLISERLGENERAVFIIDAARTLPSGSDQDWSLVLRRLGDEKISKIKFIFTQRPDDALAASGEFRELEHLGLAVRLPAGGLGVLSEADVASLVDAYAQRTGIDRRALADAVSRYDRHPYAVHAALQIIATAEPARREAEIARVRQLADPTPRGIAREQRRLIAEKGVDALRLLEAHAVLEVPAPDVLARSVAGVSDIEHRRLLADRYLATLLRTERAWEPDAEDSAQGEAAGRTDFRVIYHAILADTLLAEMGPDGQKPYHARAAAFMRESLDRAKREHTKPDAMHAVRLAVHALASEPPERAVEDLVDRCFFLLYQLGRLADGEAALQSAMRSRSSDGVMAGCLGNLGLIERDRGNLDAAEAYHKKALTIEEKLGRPEGMANQLGNLGLIERARGNLDAAEAYLKKSLALDEKLGRPEGMANQLGNLGLIERARGNLDAAEAYHKKSLAIEEKLGRPEGMAASLGNLGLIEWARGNLDAAEAYHKKALTIEEKLGRPEGMANQLGNLGLIEQTRGNLDAAEAYLKKSLTIEEKLGRPEGMANQLGNLGLIEWARGNLDAAEAYFRKSLALDEKVGHPEGMAFNFGNLGSVAKRRGNDAEARRLWTLARDLFRKVGNRPEEAKCQAALDALPGADVPPSAG